MKLVTPIPLIWGVICGAAASGNYEWRLDHVLAAFACMLMSAPCWRASLRPSTTTTTAKSTRSTSPIGRSPRGDSPGQVKLQIWVLLLAGLGVSYGLDCWAGHTTPVVFLLALGGSFVSYTIQPRSAQAERLAREYALGASYIALPWWAGQALWATHLGHSSAHPGLQPRGTRHRRGQRLQEC